MKKLLIILLLALLLNGVCLAKKEKIDFDISIQNIYLLSPEKQEYSNFEKLLFSSNSIKFEWNFNNDYGTDWFQTVLNNTINLKINNNTADLIEIIWDKSLYVDSNGNSHRIIHSNVKFIDKDRQQPNTVIAPKSLINSNIVPVDYIEYDKKNGWYVKGFLSTTNNKSKKYILKINNEYSGKSFQTLLVLKYNNQEYQYLFTFIINGYGIKE